MSQATPERSMCPFGREPRVTPRHLQRQNDPIEPIQQPHPVGPDRIELGKVQMCVDEAGCDQAIRTTRIGVASALSQNHFFDPVTFDPDRPRFQNHLPRGSVRRIGQ
jgi:hypothetical protein